MKKSKSQEKLERDFSRRGLVIMKRENLHGVGDIICPTSASWRFFKAFFGVSPAVCAATWILLLKFWELRGTKDHFLWAMIELKVYGSEIVMSKLLSIDPKTFRKHAWYFIKKISRLSVVLVSVFFVSFSSQIHIHLSCSIFIHISFYYLVFDKITLDNRFCNDEGNSALLSVDGSDFRINLGSMQVRKISSWISHKFKKPALRYEVGVCIKTGLICWIHGPFPAGKYNDIKIFKSSLMNALDDDEMVECDDGYPGQDGVNCLRPIFCNMFDKKRTRKMRQRVRSRHETVNRRFKQFNILADPFRSEPGKHSRCFRAVAVLVQLTLEMGEPLFEVQYSDI